MHKDQTIRLKKRSYQLIDALASGGQGTIWDVVGEDQQHYALKVVNLYDTRFVTPKRHSHAYLQALINYANGEIAFLTSLDNTKIKHIAACLDHGVIEQEGVELPAFIMRLYHQDDLEKRIKQHQEGVQRIDSHLWRRWFKQLMLALQSMQSASVHDTLVAHRDLKPANCLFDDEDNLYLSDFGIVRESSKTGLTSVSRVGTFDFCAPEQCFARYEGTDGIPHFYITLKLDIYSAAMLMHDMMVGSTSAQQSLTETSINQHKQTLYGVKKTNKGKIGKLGVVGGLTPKEAQNIQQTLHDLFTPPVTSHTITLHQPSLPNYQRIANETTTLLESMLAPWPDDRPDVNAVLQALARLDASLTPTLAQLSFVEAEYSVLIGQPLSLTFQMEGKGLPTDWQWLQISLDHSPLETPQIKHQQGQHYQLDLPVFSELIPQTLRLSALIKGKAYSAETQIEVQPDADYLWTAGKRLAALKLDGRPAWLNQWEAEATTVSKKFPLLAALKALQQHDPQQADALQQRYDRIDGHPSPLPKKKIAAAVLLVAIASVTAMNWQAIQGRFNEGHDVVSQQISNKEVNGNDEVEKTVTLIDPASFASHKKINVIEQNLSDIKTALSSDDLKQRQTAWEELQQRISQNKNDQPAMALKTQYEKDTLLFADSSNLTMSQKKFIKKYPQFSNVFDTSSCSNNNIRELKTNRGYFFNLTYTNTSDVNEYINNKYIIFYDSSRNPLDLTLSGNDRKLIDPGGKYEWTKILKKSAYTIKPHSSMKIIETGMKKDKKNKWLWLIKAKPLDINEKNKFSFFIQYITVYDLSNTPNNKQDDKVKISCIYYKMIK